MVRKVLKFLECGSIILCCISIDQNQKKSGPLRLSDQRQAVWSKSKGVSGFKRVNSILELSPQVEKSKISLR